MSTKITPAQLLLEDQMLPLLKTQLREPLDFIEQDELMGVYLKAAREHAQTVCNKLFSRATCIASMPCFPRLIELEIIPFVELTSIEYYDADNQKQVLPTTDYELNDKGLYAVIALKAIPATYKRHDAVIVTYEAGYETEQVPAPVKQAILLMAAEWYANREDHKRDVPRASEILLSGERIIRFY